jgi:hypothetical protein
MQGAPENLESGCCCGPAEWEWWPPTALRGHSGCVTGVHGQGGPLDDDDRDGGQPPVMLLVTGDSESRRVLDVELRRRYGTDYEVITCRTYEHARAVLDGLRHWRRDVALIMAFYGATDRQALLFLRRAHSVHPLAKRAVAVRWGEFDASQPVFQAIGQRRGSAPAWRFPPSSCSRRSPSS